MNVTQVTRALMRSLAIGFIWLSGFTFTVCATAGEKPNIVLMMADDQGWAQVGYNGHPHLKTPHLDAMAAANTLKVSVNLRLLRADLYQSY